VVDEATSKNAETIETKDTTKTLAASHFDFSFAIDPKVLFHVLLAYFKKDGLTVRIFFQFKKISEPTATA